MRADRKRNKYTRRELIHTAMRLTEEMNEHYVSGRSRLATKAVTKYNFVAKVLSSSAVNI